MVKMYGSILTYCRSDLIWLFFISYFHFVNFGGIRITNTNNLTCINYLGNHEYYYDHMSKYETLLSNRFGINVLHNRATNVNGLCLVGIDDHFLKQEFVFMVFLKLICCIKFFYLCYTISSMLMVCICYDLNVFYAIFEFMNCKNCLILRFLENNCSNF